MKWLLKFVRAGDDPGGVGLLVRVECAEEELQGEKEQMAMRLEKASGRVWICAEATKFEPASGKVEA